MAANEISLFHSSVSTVDGNVSRNDDDNNEHNIPDENMILARLNELRQWQESQRQMLADTQLDQQKMLELEKHKLYALFGISADEVRDANNTSTVSSCDLQKSQIADDFQETPKINTEQNQNQLEKTSLELHSPSINQLQKIIQNMANRSPKHQHHQQQQQSTETMTNIPKRPYLKRGEGLKSRFKMPPDAFSLDKLPKYKYAQRMQKHAQSTQSRKQRHQESTTNDTIISSAAEGVGTTSEGHQHNNSSSIDARIRSSQNNEKSSKPTTKRTSPRTLQLKLKPNPTTKAQHNEIKASSTDVNPFVHGYNQDERIEQAISQVKSPIPLSPATKILLDTPTRARVQFQQNEINELKHFVQLEQDLHNNSEFEMDRPRRDDNLVFKFKLGLNVSPKHLMANRNFGDIEEEDEDADLEQSINSDSGDESKHVRFKSNAIAIEKINQRRHSSAELSAIGLYDSVPNTSSPNDKSTESFQKFKEKLFDRRLKQKFQNRLSVAKDFEISDLNSNKSDCDSDVGDSTLATAINDTDISDVTNKLVQDRLMSLEKEIHSFREQNNELTKLIREHELIRLTFDEERRTEQERIENERINFEMYMHDQRLKILDEKCKWEKKTKEGRGWSQSEKDELMRLREKCSNHEAELIAREQKHVGAQGRIRAQLRNVEKDLKEVRLELDNLQKENKKLETENMRLRRQGNSKILNDINKRISKLAHSTEYMVNDNRFEDDSNGTNDKKPKHGVKKCSNKNAHKTVVAKVTSHRAPLNGPNRERSRSVPNLPYSESNEKFYELCTPSTENSESSSQGNVDDQSSYYPTYSSNKDLFGGAEHDECHKTETKQCDDSDNLSTSMKRVIENPDGSKDVWYPNGNLKKISADAMCIRMMYFNKDIKETDINEGTVKYYYAESNTWQTTYLDGLEIFEYPDGQTEHRYKDGKIEIHFPNGTVRLTNPAREEKEGIKEEWKYADGTSMIQTTNGERMIIMTNGQREVHANGHKRREYPDGTVKIVYPDGSQETRYSNGRVRLKNKDGKLIMDSETISI